MAARPTIDARNILAIFETAIPKTLFIPQTRKAHTSERTHNAVPYIPLNELGPAGLAGKTPFVEGKS